MDLQTGILSFKAAVDLASSLIELSTSEAGRKASCELMGQLIGAHREQLKLVESYQALQQKAFAHEAENQRLTQWDSDNERYQLEKIGVGAFAYSFKPIAGSAEPAHWLCPNCYARREKSFLLLDRRERRESFYRCSMCGTTVRVD